MALTTDETRRINDCLKGDGEVVGGAIASLYVAEFNKKEKRLDNWKNARVEGCLCLIYEFATGKHFFMLFDRESFTTRYEFEVYAGIVYRECYDNFHAYETSDGYVGFGFASTRVAKKFFALVIEKAKDPTALFSGLFFNEDGSINVQRLPQSWKTFLREAGFTDAEMRDPAMSGLVIQCLEEVGISTQAPERGMTREQLRARGYNQEQIAQYQRYEKELDEYEQEITRTNKKGRPAPPAPPRRRNKNPLEAVRQTVGGLRSSVGSGFEMASQFSAQSSPAAFPRRGASPSSSSSSFYTAPYSSGQPRPRIVRSPDDALSQSGVPRPNRPYGVSAQSAPLPSTPQRSVVPSNYYPQSSPSAPAGGRNGYNNPALQQPKRTSLTQKLRQSLRRSLSRANKAEQARPVPGGPPPRVAPRPYGSAASEKPSAPSRSRNGSDNPMYRSRRDEGQRRRDPSRGPRQRNTSRDPHRTQRSKGQTRRTRKPHRRFGDEGQYPGGTILRNQAARAPPLPPAFPALPSRAAPGQLAYPKPNLAKLRTSVLPDLGGVQRSQQEDLKARLRERLNERRKRIVDSDDED